MHVGASVTVRNRVYVEGVDLANVNAQPVCCERERVQQFTGRESGSGGMGHRHRLGPFTPVAQLMWNITGLIHAPLAVLNAAAARIVTVRPCRRGSPGAAMP